jgi:hypothetical protein
LNQFQKCKTFSFPQLVFSPTSLYIPLFSFPCSPTRAGPKHLPGPAFPGPVQRSLTPLPSTDGGSRRSDPSSPPCRAGTRPRVRVEHAPLRALARTPRGPAPAYKRRRLHPLNPSNRSRSLASQTLALAAAPPPLELGSSGRTRLAAPPLPRRVHPQQKLRRVVRIPSGSFPISLTLSFARDSSPSPPFRHASPQALPRCFSSSRCPRRVRRAARVLPEQDPS